MLTLNNVELISISSIKIEESIEALRCSSKNINFKSVKFLTHVDRHDIKVPLDGIQLIKIQELKSSTEYSDFCLSIKNYINADYVLIVQNDGFVIDYNKWDNRFLDYDYIGAPWTEKQSQDWKISNRIGNGGFSLRSKKFLEYSSMFTTCYGYNEDGFLTNFSGLSQRFGIKYPPVDLAKLFSIESLEEGEVFDPTKSFGFHGKHLLPPVQEFLKNKS